MDHASHHAVSVLRSWSRGGGWVLRFHPETKAEQNMTTGKWFLALFIVSLTMGCASLHHLGQTPADTSKRMFDFRTLTFCNLHLGDNVSTIKAVYGEPAYDGVPTSEGYRTRHTRRIVVGDIEVHCKGARISNIICSSPKIETDAGLKKGDSLAAIKAAYGNPDYVVHESGAYAYTIKGIHFVIFTDNSGVHHFEVFGRD
jgi:hypothetical protein